VGADTNGDGQVNQEDYNAWNNNNFGNVRPTPTVPEPSGFAILATSRC